jgi:lysozyme
MNNKLKCAALIAALTITAAFEGTRYIAYQDIGGIWTICTGATKGVKKGDMATPEECKSRLMVELLEHAKPLERIQHQLPDNVIVAWADFSYNLGVVALQKSSGYKLLQQGKIAESCENILDYKYVRVGERLVDCFADENAKICGGIKKRRITEYKLCVGEISIDDVVSMFN